MLCLKTWNMTNMALKRCWATKDKFALEIVCIRQRLAHTIEVLALPDLKPLGTNWFFFTKFNQSGLCCQLPFYISSTAFLFLQQISIWGNAQYLFWYFKLVERLCDSSSKRWGKIRPVHNHGKGSCKVILPSIRTALSGPNRLLQLVEMSSPERGLRVDNSGGKSAGQLTGYSNGAGIIWMVDEYDYPPLEWWVFQIEWFSTSCACLTIGQ